MIAGVYFHLLFYMFFVVFLIQKHGLANIGLWPEDLRN
jgi:hypothetical protein